MKSVFLVALGVAAALVAPGFLFGGPGPVGLFLAVFAPVSFAAGLQNIESRYVR